MFQSMKDLCENYPKMRAPLIHGLLREGETCSLVASPKTGMSFLCLEMALTVCTGKPFLGMATKKCRVLIIDTELHADTISERIDAALKATKLSRDVVNPMLSYQTLRGRQISTFGDMETVINFNISKDEKFGLVIIDSFNSLIPRCVDENSNAEVMEVYRLIDAAATRLNAAFVLRHHQPKMTRLRRSLQGAGATCESRACDTRVVITPHERQPGLYVFEAATRSFPPMPKFLIEHQFPLWRRVEDAETR